MRRRIYVEKKTEYAYAARRLHRHLTEHLGMHTVRGVRILRCLFLETTADIGELPVDMLIDTATETFVSEDSVRAQAELPDAACHCVIPLFRRPAEVLTGQALGMILRRTHGADVPVLDTEGDSPLYFRQADLFLVFGIGGAGERERLKRLLINPASSAEFPLFTTGNLPPLSRPMGNDLFPVRDFRAMDDEALMMFSVEENFRMSENDLRFIQSYFRVEEKRDPRLFELRMMDTYWSDHCRHITFLTALQDISIEDREIAEAFELYLCTREELYAARPKNITLMDIATLPKKYLLREGKLRAAVEVGEQNAFTVRTNVYMREEGEGIRTDADRDMPPTGTPVPWLLHFKNETHNYSTEQDPYFGAFSSFGATIADPLSARAEVFAAMRLSGTPSPLSMPVTGGDDGAADRRAAASRLIHNSADGFAAFGVQCGIPTGGVQEYYHPDFAAKHLEVCFSAAAVPEEDCASAQPVPGDFVVLVGAKTGRDGLGGGLSASAVRAGHTMSSRRGERSPHTSQMGDPQATRALLRLMRRQDMMRLCKRAEDISSGGIAVAAAEIARGVRIDLDRVPTASADRLTAAGVMDPYEIAFSETQGRMLLVISAIHEAQAAQIAAEEDLDLTVVGTVTAEPRFRMMWRDVTLLSLSRDFLDATGAERRAGAYIPQADTEHLFRGISDRLTGEDLTERYLRVMMHPEVCSQKSLSEHFDATVGGHTVLYPMSGKTMLTPTGYAAFRYPVERMGGGETGTCAVFAYGYLPRYAAQSPYHGAYLAVLEVLCKLAAAGIPLREVALSLQEYFPSVGSDPARFGKPLAAILGAFRAQMDYEVAAIGGKDSMNGTSELGDVPPTVIAFGAASTEQENLITPHLKKAGTRVYLLTPAYEESHLPSPQNERELLSYLHKIQREGKVLSCAPVAPGGVAATLAKMCMGESIGFNYEGTVSARMLFEDRPGAFLVETEHTLRGILIGYTKDAANIYIGGTGIPLAMLSRLWRKPEEKLYDTQMTAPDRGIVPAFPCTMHSVQRPYVATRTPRVLLPVLPYISGEDMLAARFSRAGFEVMRFLFSCRTQEDCRRSSEQLRAMLEDAQVLAFAGGSYPGYCSIPAAVTDPAARFSRAIFSSLEMQEALERFGSRSDTLALGLGEGFRMLLSTPLMDTVCAGDPFSLTENPCGHLAAKMLRVRVMSVSSPWMHFCETGQIYTLPAASKAGRCLIPGEMILELGAHGQIAGQYVDEDNNPTMDPEYNPFGSDYAVEGIFSHSGRVMGRMTYPDRVDNSLCINVPGNKDMRIFEAAMEYYRIR